MPVQVEALESGVFRSDLPTRFKLEAAAYQVAAARLRLCRRPWLDCPVHAAC